MPQHRRGSLAGYARVDEYRYREVLDQQHVLRGRWLELEIELAPLRVAFPPLKQEAYHAVDPPVELSRSVDQLHVTPNLSGEPARRGPAPRAWPFPALPAFIGSR